MFGRETIIVRIAEDAMAPRVRAGDYVWVDPDEPAADGRFVAVRDPAHDAETARPAPRRARRAPDPSPRAAKPLPASTAYATAAALRRRHGDARGNTSTGNPRNRAGDPTMKEHERPPASAERARHANARKKHGLLEIDEMLHRARSAAPRREPPRRKRRLRRRIRRCPDPPDPRGRARPEGAALAGGEPGAREVP